MLQQTSQHLLGLLPSAHTALGAQLQPLVGVHVVLVLGHPGVKTLPPLS